MVCDDATCLLRRFVDRLLCCCSRVPRPRSSSRCLTCLLACLLARSLACSRQELLASNCYCPTSTARRMVSAPSRPQPHSHTDATRRLLPAACCFFAPFALLSSSGRVPRHGFFFGDCASCHLPVVSVPVFSSSRKAGRVFSLVLLIARCPEAP